MPHLLLSGPPFSLQQLLWHPGAHCSNESIFLIDFSISTQCFPPSTILNIYGTPFSHSDISINLKVQVLTTQGVYLDHLALEPLNTYCSFVCLWIHTAPLGDNLGCITHGSSEVPSRTETPDNLSGGEFSKTPQIVSWSLFNSLQHPTLILRYNLSK